MHEPLNFNEPMDSILLLSQFEESWMGTHFENSPYIIFIYFSSGNFYKGFQLVKLFNITCDEFVIGVESTELSNDLTFSGFLF